MSVETGPGEGSGLPPFIGELAQACQEGKEAEVRAILQRQDVHAARWNKWEPGGQTLLMWAAREGELRVAKALVEGEEQVGLSSRLDMQVSR